MSATPRPLAFRYTTLEFNTLPLFARDTILELEAQNQAMREALRPFAQLDIDHLSNALGTTPLYGINNSIITIGQVRQAKAALALAGNQHKEGV